MSTSEERPPLRLFCALVLPSEVHARIDEHSARLRQAHPDARSRWERADKLHITLKFLGAVERERVASLEAAIKEAAASVPHFSLNIEGSGIFPPRGAPRVLWLGVRLGAERLRVLQQSLEARCFLQGFAREARPFHPHLTIARINENSGETRLLARLHRAAQFSSAPFAVREVILMMSELRPGGSRHTPLARCALGGSIERIADSTTAC